MDRLEIPANAEKKQGRGKFQKGQSGNPNGKTRGTKNKVTLAAEIMLKGELENICRRLIQEALSGNIQALKMVLDRIMPVRKDRPIEIDLPPLKTSSDALRAISVIVESVGDGSISPNEGEALSKIVNVYVNAIESHDYENRLLMLEGRSNK